MTIRRLPDIKGPKDFFAGCIFAAVGIVLFIGSQEYEIGSAVSMGPGYFPALCGLILIGLGLGAIVKGLRAREFDPIAHHKIEPLFLILASIVSFGLLIESAGLIVATFVSLFFACFRRVRSKPLEVLATFVVLTTFNVAVFVYAFGMPIRLFWRDP